MICGDDLAAVLLNDAVRDGQPEAGPFPDFLRRVERLENTRQRFLRTVAMILSPDADTEVATSIRPFLPVAAIACSAFMTMFTNT